ncbi:hypothetical protein TSAR_007782 [Trichomalopsis sarcophagae]|uniref:Uncharacterized protein n=1 Tax=Trichomalopsis sarcophagae TaxID=543379 RepID=A0A232FL78_9HYME|nr:hypothetical protein TSAR_007782 [Trichomalopsis sarcophagae]
MEEIFKRERADDCKEDEFPFARSSKTIRSPHQRPNAEGKEKEERMGEVLEQLSGITQMIKEEKDEKKRRWSIGRRSGKH